MDMHSPGNGRPAAGHGIPGMRDRIPAALVLLAVASLYWYGRNRSPGWGDSLGFLVSALEGPSWSVNATGHFLYDNINVMLVSLFSAADPVSILTAASLASALATVVIVYRAVERLTGSQPASACGVPGA